MGSCTKSGYRWCWEDIYCYGPVCAQPRIYWQFEDSDGNDVWDTYPYCYGDLYIRSGYSGTFSVNGYGFYNAPSWDSIWNRFWTDEYGVHINIQDYDFTPPYNGGRIKVASVGQTFTKCVVLVAYDWNTDGDYWVATGTGYGWVGTGNCVSIQCVEPPPDYQYYDIDGTPSGAEIWEGSTFHGVAGMTLALPYTDHYLTFKKSGYYDQTIHVGTKPGGDIIYVRYSLEPISFNISANQVHHEDYAYLHTSEEAEHCISLCGSCHRLRHEKLSISIEFLRNKIDNNIFIGIYHRALKQPWALKEEREQHDSFIKSLTITPEELLKMGVKKIGETINI